MKKEEKNSFGYDNRTKDIKQESTTKKNVNLGIVNCIAGFVVCRSLDSRFAIPIPSDRNALRNPPRQYVPTVSNNFTIQ